MKDMVTSDAYRQMPLGTLALHARRLGRVFASASIRCKKMRERGWRRPRKRLYTAEPKVDICASKPSDFWHRDATIIRLLDGTRVFVHAVVDNFSRPIHAWDLCEKLTPRATVAILREAAANLGVVPTLVTDSGVESVNSEVDVLIQDGALTRILTFVEVAYSNSIVEAYWRSLKHQWLFLNQLDNVKALEKLVDLHVVQHTAVMPHSAFDGQAPDEVYFCIGEHVVDELAAARERARQKGLVANGAAWCVGCAAEIGAKSTWLQLRRLAS